MIIIYLIFNILHRYLINRLDQHGDAWRDAPMGVLEENSIFECTPKQEKSSKILVNNVKEEKPKKGTKRKGTKADPNAPKRPANPFFQFCQEQRPRVMERLAGEPEPSKQELTRQLATTWKSLSTEDKKVINTETIITIFNMYKLNLIIYSNFRYIMTCMNDQKKNMLQKCKSIIKKQKMLHHTCL